MAEGCKLKSVFDTQIPPRHQASFRFDLKRSVAKQNALQVNLLFGATHAKLFGRFHIAIQPNIP